ncbi:hypothetical protein CsatB_000986 [Cannabis sativa]
MNVFSLDTARDYGLSQSRCQNIKYGKLVLLIMSTLIISFGTLFYEWGRYSITWRLLLITTLFLKVFFFTIIVLLLLFVFVFLVVITIEERTRWGCVELGQPHQTTRFGSEKPGHLVSESRTQKRKKKNRESTLYKDAM